MNRDLILDETKVAFDRMIKNDNSAVLEVKFKNEVSSYFLLNCHDYLIHLCYFQEGHGIGPTKEFFSILSKEIQRFDLKLWRGEENSGLEDAEVAYVHCANGLFSLAIPYKVQVDQIIPAEFE